MVLHFKFQILLYCWHLWKQLTFACSLCFPKPCCDDNFREFLWSVFVCSTQMVKSSVNKSLWPTWLFPPFLIIAVFETSRMMMNRSGKSRHLSLFLIPVKKLWVSRPSSCQWQICVLTTKMPFPLFLTLWMAVPVLSLRLWIWSCNCFITFNVMDYTHVNIHSQRRVSTVDPALHIRGKSRLIRIYSHGRCWSEIFLCYLCLLWQERNSGVINVLFPSYKRHCR